MSVVKEVVVNLGCEFVENSVNEFVGTLSVSSLETWCTLIEFLGNSVIEFVVNSVDAFVESSGNELVVYPGLSLGDVSPEG